MRTKLALKFCPVINLRKEILATLITIFTRRQKTSGPELPQTEEKHTRRATVVSEPATETMNNPHNLKNRVGGKCSFCAGQIQQFSESWKKLTSDKTILSIEFYLLAILMILFSLQTQRKHLR